MADNAKIKVGGDAKEADKELKRVKKGMQELIRKNKNLENTSKKTAKSGSSDLASMAKGYIGVTAVVTGLVSGIKAAANETLRLRRVTDDVNRTLDAQKTATRTQMGIRQGTDDSGVLDDKINDLAKATGQSINFISQGFEGISSGGASTRSLLDTSMGEKILSALLALQSKDLGGDAKAFIAFLDNSGLGQSDEGIQKAFQFASKAKQTGVFEIRDLVQLGKMVSIAISAGLPFNQIIAGFVSILNKTGNASDAQTSFKTIITKGQVATGSKDAVKALSSIGIKASEIDFNDPGEDLISFRKKFTEAQKKFPKKFPIAVKKAFEEQGQLGILNLLSSNKFDQALTFGGDNSFLDVALFNQGKGNTAKRDKILDARAAKANRTGSTDISLDQIFRNDDILLDKLHREGEIGFLTKKNIQLSRFINQFLPGSDDSTIDGSTIFGDIVGDVDPVVQKKRDEYLASFRRENEDPNLEKNFMEKAKLKNDKIRTDLFKSWTGNSPVPEEVNPWGFDFGQRQ